MDHNVSESLQEAMRRGLPQHRIEGMPEQPNQRITVTIRLNLRNESSQNNHAPTARLQPDLSHLKTVLENEYNMEDITLEQDPEEDIDILIIEGIPPDHDFGPQQVLQVVQDYAPNALLVPADD